jgi:hypothetical protein
MPGRNDASHSPEASVPGNEVSAEQGVEPNSRAGMETCNIFSGSNLGGLVSFFFHYEGRGEREREG